MIIGFFKRNAAASLLLIPIAVILLWIPGMLHSSPLEADHAMPLYKLMVDLLAPYPWAHHITAILFVLLEAFILNQIMDSNEVLVKATYLTGFMYGVLMCALPTLLTIHPLVFANVFLIAALGRTFGMYRKNTAFPNAFDAGMLISIASLFYFPCIVFFIVLWFSLIILRPFVWREWIISLLGLLAPYCFAFTYYFVTDTVDYLWYDKMLYPLALKTFGFNLPNSYYILFALLGFLLILSLIKLLNTIASQSVRARSIMLVFVWCMLFGFVAFALSPNWSSQYLSILAIPLSVFFANYLMTVKRAWWAEFTFLVLLGVILYNQLSTT